MAEKQPVSFEDLRTQQIITANSVNDLAARIIQLEQVYVALAKLVNSMRDCVNQQTDIFDNTGLGRD